ncbi:solute carrier family 30 protein [Naegleria gruberi]|uniref:Solute carrier family 30 protein n=1 Tax=Naegleria gruberi TaxID=5762 RepID=D2V151_NAEGR|nr:solute carrier family 30 protein [Naegleria gruberi]EFC49632.1 solute carrier family 30 protein [Naegleria gruberi]|eukprot:XP_002682376.1 solute carrier family 30 protein [Naegleria gruberi strain NEG-M]
MTSIDLEIIDDPKLVNSYHSHKKHNHNDHHHLNHHHKHSCQEEEEELQPVELTTTRVRLDNSTLRKIYLSKNKPLWKEADFIKMIIMIAMIFVMFGAELSVGILAASLTLLADSFHMLSDGISLIVGAACIWLAKKGPTANMTFGFGRAETLGGLINAVFLVSVVLYVIMESIQRFFMPERIEDPILVLCVGGAGLLINLIGLFMFCGHHPGHDHDHGHEHDHKHSKEEDHQHESHEHDHEHTDPQSNNSQKKEHKEHKHRSENIFGVFLHILGDFLGSVAVMISSGLILIFDQKDEQGNYPNTWVLYVDPVLSLVMSGIILFTAVPLLKSTCRTLLQSVPTAVDIPQLKANILEVEGVISCHELHVWQLAGKTSVASVHILTSESNEEFMRIVKRVQQIFHKFNVHATTIQPEFISLNSMQGNESQPCHLICSPSCYEQFCCAPNPVEMDIVDPSNKV